MKGIAGHSGKKVDRQDRSVRHWVRKYPDFWPGAVRKNWRQAWGLPTHDFDEIMAKIARLEAAARRGPMQYRNSDGNRMVNADVPVESGFDGFS
jgi:hypothetical protein